jgi:hypothetical protein
VRPTTATTPRAGRRRSRVTSSPSPRPQRSPCRLPPRPTPARRPRLSPARTPDRATCLPRRLRRRPSRCRP